MIHSLSHLAKLCCLSILQASAYRVFRISRLSGDHEPTLLFFGSEVVALVGVWLMLVDVLQSHFVLLDLMVGISDL